MGAYSKLFGGIIGSGVGYLVGAAAVWAASKGLGTCDVSGTNCAILGISADAISNAILGLATYFGIYIAPKNADA